MRTLDLRKVHFFSLHLFDSLLLNQPRTRLLLGRLIYEIRRSMLLISHVVTFPIWRMSQSWPTQSTLLLSQACNINPCIKDCRGEQNEGSRDSCSNLGGVRKIE